VKAYLATTGAIFGIVALLHLRHAIADWSMLKTNPGEFLVMAALGVLAAGLAGWAWVLFRRSPRS
jgi:hypothetical protein